MTSPSDAWGFKSQASRSWVVEFGFRVGVSGLGLGFRVEGLGLGFRV